MTDSRVAVAVRAVDDRREQAVALLEQLLRSMDVPATLDIRDLPDGTISISVIPEVELAVLYLMAAVVLLIRPAGVFGRP